MKKAQRIFSTIAAIAMLTGSAILPANSITASASTQGDKVRNLAIRAVSDHKINTDYANDGSDWCAAFATSILKQAGISTKCSQDSYVTELVATYLERGIFRGKKKCNSNYLAWQTSQTKKSISGGLISASYSANYQPQVGDLIFFDVNEICDDYWADPDHVGIVNHVDNGYVYVIEGNHHGFLSRETSNSGNPLPKVTNLGVYRYLLNDPMIYGYVAVSDIAAPYAKGDINKDGSVDIADLARMKQYVSKDSSVPSVDSYTADINFDGITDMTDLTMLAIRLMYI